MRKFFIWYHRRRAAYHEACAEYYKATGGYVCDVAWHRSWASYHTEILGLHLYE